MSRSDEPWRPAASDDQGGIPPWEEQAVERDPDEDCHQRRLTDQTGKGNKDIVRAYGPEAFEFSYSFLTVRIPYNPLAMDGNEGAGERDVPVNADALSESEIAVLSALAMNPNLVREQLAEMLGKSVKTVARALDSLKKKRGSSASAPTKTGIGNFREEAAMASEARSFDPTVLCKSLRWLRANASLSQTAVARELGVSQNSVWKYESGQAEPSIRVLVWYSDRFSVSPSQLLYGDLASGISKKKRS